MSSDAADAVYGANARQIQGRTHQVGTLPCAVVRDWRADVWVLNSKIHLTQDDLLFFCFGGFGRLRMRGLQAVEAFANLMVPKDWI